MFPTEANLVLSSLEVKNSEVVITAREMAPVELIPAKALRLAWEKACEPSAAGPSVRGGRATPRQERNDLGGAAKAAERNLVLMYDNQGMLLKGIK